MASAAQPEACAPRSPSRAASRVFRNSCLRKAARSRRLMVIPLLAVLAFAKTDPACAAESTEATSIKKWSLEVGDCFAGELLRLQRSDPKLPVEVSGFAKGFVYEQIVGALSPQNTPTAWEKLAATPARIFCTETVVPAYLAAYRKGLEEVGRETKGSLAGLGTGAIESSSPFVQFGQNHFGVHTRGHYDITVAALDGLPSGFTVSSQATKLLASASQTPDLYRWSNETFHAHTSEFADGDANDRAKQLAESKKRYVVLIGNLLTQFQSSVRVRDDAEALFQLGVTAHLVQDLIYHRGMTLRQHAGLSYFLKKNPDFPVEPLGQRRWDEAVQQTKRLFRYAIGKVGEAEWRRLLTWNPSPDFEFAALAKKMFVKDQDIGVAALVDYYLLISPYIEGTRSKDELQDTGCAPDRGLACWDPTAVLATVFER